MPGLVPGIHVFLVPSDPKDVDCRDKPGHDELIGRCGQRCVQCLCATETFSNAAFLSGDVSFWCFAFHCSNGSP